MKKVEKLSDEELVKLVRSKDQELYRFLVKRYQKKLSRYARYLVKDESLAADVVQESLIKAFVNLKGFDTGKKFSSWVYRITHNQAVNLLKKEKKHFSLEKSGWLDLLPAREPEVLEKISQEEIRKLVSRSLKNLPVIYGEPLALYYLEEKSYEEISDILRIPLGTVGTRINRGKKMMAKRIKNEEKNQ